MGSAATLFDPERARAAERALARRDPRLAELVRAFAPVDLPRRRPGGGFSFLVRSVLYQQLAIPAARAITGRVETACAAGGALRAEALLRLGAKGLAPLGVSGPKARTLLGLAEAERAGALRTAGLSRLPDERVTERLTEQRGIGRWTAQMFLIFHLGRPDVFPEGDLGVRHALATLLGEPEPPGPARALAAAETWRPDRTMAALLLWRLRSGRPAAIR